MNQNFAAIVLGGTGQVGGKSGVRTSLPASICSSTIANESSALMSRRLSRRRFAVNMSPLSGLTGHETLCSLRAH
jgi:hypothetical protein